MIKSLDADVYHIHEFVLLPLVPYLYRINKKVIYDMHENFPLQYQDSIALKCGKFIGKIAGKILLEYENRKMCKASGTIVVSTTNNALNRAKKFCGNAEMIRNFPLLEKERSHLRSFEEYEDCWGNLCFVGGIEETWCHEFLLQGIEHINDVKYYVAGPRTPEYLSRLKKMNAWKKVVDLSVISSGEVKQLYDQSYMGIALADYIGNLGYTEGTWGNTKLFEYMYAGLPIICTDFDIWTEIVKRGECGIAVNAHNSKEIYEAIIYLLENPKKAFEMGQRGRNLVLEQYNWSKEEPKLYKIYEQILRKVD